MIQLRVVGSTDDHRLLLLSDKSRGTRGSFSIPIDRELLEVLQAAVYARRDGARRDGAEEPAESLSAGSGAPRAAPREIQRLLRAGMSVERVADVLDCDEDLVERFVTPILYERSGVIQDVQRLFVQKSRLGVSGLSLRDAIETNLASRRIRLTEDEYIGSWDANREEGQPWKLTYTFDFRGKQVARFSYDPRTARIEPVNKVALDIGWVPEGTEKPNIPPPMPGGKPRRRPAARAAASRKTSRSKTRTPARKPAAAAAKSKKRATARKTTARKTAARKPAARKPAARKTAARKPAARKTAARKPAARKTAARKPAARKTAARKPAARKTASARSSSRRSSTRR